MRRVGGGAGPSCCLGRPPVLPDPARVLNWPHTHRGQQPVAARGVRRNRWCAQWPKRGELPSPPAPPFPGPPGPSIREGSTQAAGRPHSLAGSCSPLFLLLDSCCHGNGLTSLPLRAGPPDGPGREVQVGRGGRGLSCLLRGDLPPARPRPASGPAGWDPRAGGPCSLSPCGKEPSGADTRPSSCRRGRFPAGSCSPRPWQWRQK